MDPEKQLEHVSDLLTKIKEALMATEQRIKKAQITQYDPADLYAGTTESAAAHALLPILPSPATPAEEDK